MLVQCRCVDSTPFFQEIALPFPIKYMPRSEVIVFVLPAPWLKSELEMGPIYHWRDKRIQAHIMICFLSLILKVFLNKKLHEYNEKLSYPESMASLKRLKVVEMEVGCKEVHVTTNIESKAKSVFKAINMRSPEKILYESPNLPGVVENILS